MGDDGLPTPIPRRDRVKKNAKPMTPMTIAAIKHPPKLNGSPHLNADRVGSVYASASMGNAQNGSELFKSGAVSGGSCLGARTSRTGNRRRIIGARTRGSGAFSIMMRFFLAMRSSVSGTRDVLHKSTTSLAPVQYSINQGVEQRRRNLNLTGLGLVFDLGGLN